MSRIRSDAVLFLAPWLVLAAVLVLWIAVSGWWIPRLIEDAYAGRSVGLLNGIIRDHDRPLSFYLEEWRERRSKLVLGLMVTGGAFACCAANLAVWLRRQARAHGKLRPGQLDRAVLWLTVAGTASLLLLMAFPALTGNVYVYDDLGVFHLPLRVFYASSLAAGDDPTWCPDLFCGFYAHAEGQMGMYHPLKLGLYGVLPLPAAFNIDTLLAYPFALVGGYVFLRRWPVHRGAAAVGAFTFAFGAFLPMRLNHTHVIQILAHIPWLLFAIDVVFRGRALGGRLAAQAGIALLTASQLLIGSPQAFYYSCVVELLYGLSLSVGQRQLKPLLLVGVAKSLGLALGAIQVLPTAEMLPLSLRAEPTLAFVGQDSLVPWNFAQLFSPYLFQERAIGAWWRWEFCVYAGVTAPLLFLWLICRHRVPRARRTLFWFGAVLSAVGAALAIGKFSPAFPWLASVPVMGMFRCWCRYTLLIQIGLSIMTALAVDALLRRWKPSRIERQNNRALRSVVTVLLLAYAVLIALALAKPSSALAAPLGSPLAMLVGPVLLLTAYALLSRAEHGVRLALLGLVFLHVADLCWYDASYLLTRCPFDPLDDYIRSVDVPPGQPGERLLGEDAYQPNQPTLRNWRMVNGYAGLPPRKSLDYRKTESLQIAGARWKRDKTWQPVPSPLASTRLVTRAVVSQTPADLIERVDCRTTAIVSKPVALSGGKPGTATLCARRNGQIRIRTVGTGRQLLVVAESFFPGWTATIDGRPAELIRVYGDFIGCVVDGGQHDVRLAWRPKGLRQGVFVACLGAIMLPPWIAAQILCAKFRAARSARTCPCASSPAPGPGFRSGRTVGSASARS